jgi:cytochrome c biogenesis protein ResB
MASNYESIVTKIDDDTPRQVHIRMNEPLRDQGYTFFQASFGPKDAQPGQPMFSVFEVVNNPADQWPLYACIIITLGMSLHFVQKLYAYLKRQNRKASA